MRIKNFKKRNQNALVIFVRLWKQFSRLRKIQSIGLLVLMLFSGYAELLSLSSIIPFLSILSDPSNILNFPLLEILPLKSISQEKILLITCLIFISAISLAGSIKCLSLYLIGKFSEKVGNKLSYRCFSSILMQDYNYHLNQNSSDLIATLTVRINGTVFGINTMFQIAAAFLVVLSLLIGLFLINWKVASTMIVIFLVAYGLLIKSYKNEITSNAKKEDNFRVKRIKVIQESLGFIRNIILDGNQNLFSRSYLNLDSVERRLITRNNFLGSSPRFILEMIGMSAIALIGTFWTISLNSQTNIIPLLGAMALAAQRLLPALQQIYAGWVQIKTTNAGTIFVLDILEQSIPRQNKKNNKLIFSKEFAINSVSFNYNFSKSPMLEDINLKIIKGEHIGIIGKTGSGKTTLFDLIMCLLYPQSGSLSVDGKFINGDNVESWRSQIAHVPQNIFLSDGTIKENIAFGILDSEVDHDLLYECASIARISEYIESLPRGYNTSVGERGIKLSGGQIQRIGIARALYKKSSILLMDESTSALDNLTEKNVLDGIQKRMSSLTLIMIAHRITTLEKCNRIIKLEKGKIVYNGPYKDL